MIEKWSAYVQRRWQIPQEVFLAGLQRLLIVVASLSFVLLTTLIVAFDEVFIQFNPISNLSIGDVAPDNIIAPADATPFMSAILTQSAIEEARASVQAVYDPPDPSVARQQTQLAGQILDFIDNIRRDPFGSLEQRIGDLSHIVALTLEPRIARAMLQFDDESWNAIKSEIINVLPRVMREDIRPDRLQTLRFQLPNQVSIRFNVTEREVIVAVIEDLLRPNTFENPEATERARQAAAQQVTPLRLSFNPGQVIVRQGDEIGALDYEAIQALNLLQNADTRTQDISRAFLASIIVLVVSGLFVIRFEPNLIYQNVRLLGLLTGIFLMMLAATRFLGVYGNIYLFPASALALIYVAIATPNVALIGVMSLAFLTALMMNNSLPIATMILTGGLIGIIAVRRAERLNTFFIAGLLVGVIHAAVVGIFGFTLSPQVLQESDILGNLALSFMSGALIVPATTIAVMYVVTTLFNLPTALRLLDLSQPNKPLLQRLLRQAPGTYQHSLQVANLAEQAANAIGADAQLTHVAALYHDIGKMLNPLYFTENQQDHIGNPHDILNDPYRSADIIISHITEGDELAKQYRLPQRLRDFIREHHGTTQVFVFYKQAINLAGGDESAVDIKDFTYPGPRPQSRETAVLMLADSCEATVRAVKPGNRQEIKELVEKIIEDKRRHGQLDESGLTLSDLQTIQTIFVEILQGMFHPRIDYNKAAAKQPTAPASADESRSMTATPPKTDQKAMPVPTANSPRATVEVAHVNGTTPSSVTATVELTAKVVTASHPMPPSVPSAASHESESLNEEEEPLTEVPRLPSGGDKRRTGDLKRVASTKEEESEP